MSRTKSDSTGETRLVEQTRSRLVQFICDLHLRGNYQIQFIRETAMVVNGNSMSKGEDRMVQRRLADVTAETVTLQDGTVLTALQVAEAVAAFGDKFEEQDEALAQGG